MNIILKMIILTFSVNTFASEGTFNLELNSKTLTSQMPTLSKIYNKPIVMDNSVTTKKITISAKNLNANEAKNVISKALSLDGISIIETQNDVSFLHAKDALKSGIDVYKNKVENPLPERMATLILELPKDLFAPDVEKSLRSLYSRDGDMKVNQQKNQLVITDWTSNLIRFQDIISKSSTPLKK